MEHPNPHTHRCAHCDQLWRCYDVNCKRPRGATCAACHDATGLPGPVMVLAILTPLIGFLAAAVYYGWVLVAFLAGWDS